MSDKPIPELKPCPFCGSPAVFEGMDFEVGDIERCECTGCGMHGGSGTKARVIKHWNMRAAETALSQIYKIATERPTVGYKDGKHWSALDEIAALVIAQYLDRMK